MSTPFKPQPGKSGGSTPSSGPAPHRRGAWIGGVVVVTVAVSGYFMGLRQTNSTLQASQPVSMITSESLQRSAAETNAVPEAVNYTKVDWLRHGRNASWTNSTAQLVEPPRSPVSTNVADADRELALQMRSSRRAYNGAPPVVPHPIQQDSSASCLACHAEGLVIKDRVATKISHPHYSSCTQCHVPSGGPGIQIQFAGLREPLTTNFFVGASEPAKGERAWPTAPPTVPHSTHMRDDCLSCHGSRGLFGLRTPHPERQSCQQCHVPSADRDHRRFLGILAQGE